MKLRMPIKPLTTEEVSESSHDLLEDARSWFANLFSFVKLDETKFPKHESHLAFEFSRDKDYL